MQKLKYQTIGVKCLCIVLPGFCYYKRKIQYDLFNSRVIVSVFLKLCHHEDKATQK